jgi:hypothetical protein
MEMLESAYSSTTSEERPRVDEIAPVLDPIAYPRFPQRPPKLRFSRLDRPENNRNGIAAKP